MSVQITGLDALRKRLDVLKTEATRERRQEEARIVRDYAKAISPTRTREFLKGWRFRTNRREFIVVYNDVPYSGHVHASGSSLTVEERVRQFAEDRAPQLADDLAQIVSDRINRG
jgi:hypothetical protein